MGGEFREGRCGIAHPPAAGAWSSTGSLSLVPNGVQMEFVRAVAALRCLGLKGTRGAKRMAHEGGDQGLVDVLFELARNMGYADHGVV